MTSSVKVLKDRRFHFNVRDDMIVTEDEMRIHLNEFVASARKCQKWHAPTGMLLTELVAFAASSFHSAIGLSGEQWDMLFRVLLGVTLVWLLKVLSSGRRVVSVDGLIDSLKDK
jgi:hypothetical protein